MSHEPHGVVAQGVDSWTCCSAAATFMISKQFSVPGRIPGPQLHLPATFAFATLSRCAADQLQTPPGHSVKAIKSFWACACFCCRPLSTSEGEPCSAEPKQASRSAMMIISCRTPCSCPRPAPIWPSQPRVGRHQLVKPPKPTVRKARRVTAAGLLDKLFGSKVFLVPGWGIFGSAC